MYLNIISHDAKKSVSSSNIFQYLDKENSEEKLKNQNLIAEGKEEEINPNSVEHFFNQDFNPYDLEDKNSMIDVYEASMQIDKNRGTQSLSSSNFYMLNISPSQKELEHMEKIAIEELENRGLKYDEIKDSVEVVEFYEEQKDQLMKLQMKLFTKDVMEEYARQMDREIYANQEALPDNAERKAMQPEIDKRYNDFLKSKGIEVINGKEIIEVDFLKKTDLDKGSIFTLYQKEIDKNVSLYVPNSKFKIEGQKLFIDEEYYTNKISNLIAEETKNKQLVSVSSLAVGSNKSIEKFKDYEKREQLVIAYDWKQQINNLNIDETLKLYFDKSELDFDKGLYYVSENTYNKKVYEAQRSFLIKNLQEERKKIYDNLAKHNGFDFSKNDDGEYINPDKVPTGKHLKNFNTKVSVEFNKFLDDNYIKNPAPKLNISNWQSYEEIDVKVLAESEKAILVDFEDENLGKKWIGKFAIEKAEDYDLGEQHKIKILKDFYVHIRNENIFYLKGDYKELEDYKEVFSVKEKNIKDESIEFCFKLENIDSEFSFNIAQKDLKIIDGEYYLNQEDFKVKYDKHLIEHCKNTVFKDEYKKIEEEVNKSNEEKTQFFKDKETDRLFTNLLVDKNIIEVERNDRYNISIKAVEEKNQSTLFSFKPNDYEKEVRFWVNNKDFEKEKDKFYFKREDKINGLISKAIERDKEQNKMVEIPFNHYTSKDIKSKEDKMLTFYKEEKGFKEPLPFTFKASELEERDGKFYVENFKLQYRMEKAKDLAIRKEYGEKKEEFKNQVWKENGFDTTKRKIEGKDLLYFAKVERNRTYSHKDKEVLRNRPILKKIEEYKNSKNPLKKMKISDLQNELLRDKYTGEVIKEGVKKGGMNYHTHIIVSRHDKTSINPKDKVSMSPNANQREGVLNNGAKVGFDRDMFFQKVENIFDTKFEYNRQETEKYVNVNQKKKSYNKALTGELKGRLIGKVEKIIGIDTVKQELNPIRKAKQEIMPIPLPSSLPKSKIDLVIKMVKVLKNALDKGVQY
ncbi:DUF5712 family protein [Riemerella anatipestifer]|uniref:DUF5712 family protein n=1 Tax=Riemerella anatipestifer TaxID=34085 RepID=UPI00129E886B|nr:DUF5712 family protein [Riemerella anatipestifer]MRM84279.1 hypothetical protein [Riemerella anatipestifer]